VAKPAGPSSYDVIRTLKRALQPGRARIGHAGTLDPLASGVLLVLLADATKLSGLLMASPKEYRAEVLLGRATDTDDTAGRTIETLPVPALAEDAVRAALSRFVGDIEQVPPAFSALKQDGRPLYALARRGEPVRPRSRRVKVHRLELVEFAPPRLVLLAEVSSGTYVRALARDLARALGTCGTLSALVRTRSGAFRVEDCAAPGSVTPDTLARSLRDVVGALPDLPRLELTREAALHLGQGKHVPLPAPLPGEGPAFALTADRRFVALVSPEDGLLRCRRVICNHARS